jgi:hypothetical protein
MLTTRLGIPPPNPPIEIALQNDLGGEAIPGQLTPSLALQC